MNTNELKAQMARHGDTLDDLAKALIRSKTSICEKVNGKRNFTQSEITTIKQRYSLTSDEIDLIFFDLKVD